MGADEIECRTLKHCIDLQYREAVDQTDDHCSVAQARDFLNDLGENDWRHACPEGSFLSGDGYKNLWRVLSGEKSS